MWDRKSIPLVLYVNTAGKLRPLGCYNTAFLTAFNLYYTWCFIHVPANQKSPLIKLHEWSTVRASEPPICRCRPLELGPWALAPALWPQMDSLCDKLKLLRHQNKNLPIIIIISFQTPLSPALVFTLTFPLFNYSLQGHDLSTGGAKIPKPAFVFYT